ncbi:CCCH zinc finger domain-containing protein [Dioscorea alata]|uniref:CCCH zinc finger domain-containing protein n=1 Tax=Dioscorea alata TaxID=55571 RepID=A0ACB7WJ55_DIOAL|nr:CCCH zinc finger domain-containing protein [Dioscorea alata]
MAGDDGGGGEEEVERQLEKQLNEQKESLAAVDEALACDPANLELLAVHEELLAVIRDAEQGLLHLKRFRLLKEADAIFTRQVAVSVSEDVKVEALDSAQVEPEPLESECYSIGSKCRFRHKDGRWYNGNIISFEGDSSARISFLNPTSESMLMCKFFLQQRCRFGGNCRLSHGFDVPVSSLKQYIPTKWHQSSVGSNIWAISESQSGIWRKAELELLDDDLGYGQVVFLDDGTSAKLKTEALSISNYAEMSSDDEDEDLSSESSEFTGEEEDLDDETDHQGLGFLEATKLQRGIQTETAVFAQWENHTRGIASKMMASMGYREGMALGASGKGIVDPITVKILRPRQSLDHAFASNESEEKKVDHNKKRSRGGKRKRDKKHAAAARAAKAEEEMAPDVFSFINNQLTGQDVVNGSGNKQKKQSDGTSGSMKKVDRRSLVAYEDEVKELRNRVEKLEEMVNRNRKDKAMYEAASRKLIETRKALADAEAAHVSASNAVVNKEKEKKWLRF